MKITVFILFSLLLFTKWASYLSQMTVYCFTNNTKNLNKYCILQTLFVSKFSACSNGCVTDVQVWLNYCMIKQHFKLDSPIHNNSFPCVIFMFFSPSTIFCLFASVRCGFFFETLPKGQKLVFSVHCSMKLPAETLLEALMCLSSCCCAHGLFSSLSVLIWSSLLAFFMRAVHEIVFIS